MDDAYRLVFRGEVLDGQHPAVVKKRLMAALKLSDAQADKLFAGSAVVLKQQADGKTAARLQGVFKQAGARLRVTPVPGNDAPHQDAADPPAPHSAAQADVRPAMQVLPVGSDVLRSDERPQRTGVSVDVSHLGIVTGDPQPLAHAPVPVSVRVPEFSVADVGADLADHAERPTIDIDVHFEVAEVGADIPTIPVDRTPIVDIEAINFDVAEVAADIGARQREAAPAAPDTSHLSVVAE